MTLGNVGSAAVTRADETRPPAGVRTLCDILGQRLAHERCDWPRTAARQLTERALETFIDEDRGAFHMMYDIIPRSRDA